MKTTFVEAFIVVELDAMVSGNARSFFGVAIENLLIAHCAY